MSFSRVEDLSHDQLRGFIANDAQPEHVTQAVERYLQESSRSPENSTSPSNAGTSSSYASPPGETSDNSTASSTGRFEIPNPFHRLSQSRSKEGSEDKPKRRGPKPDSKPALTRRQELNRQAQRTHRERKEKYVKSLEEDVVRLREAFNTIVSEKTRILEENRRLKELLTLHGISFDANDFRNTNAALDLQNQPAPPEVQRLGRTYDELGVDFVLALEEACLNHGTFLINRSVNDPKGDIHGHALMLSCPPESFTIEHPNEQWGSKTIDLPPADLTYLFHLSQRLQLDGEITPIAVWATITRLEQFAQMDMADFEFLKQELKPKVTCHGFGAVVLEGDMYDAFDKLYASKFGLSFVAYDI